ncbi:hypothetical protein [Arthrobacter sp. GMC3]|uniref:hypothetical protein n=1 Tax=Arthrobacter sp. GMC3 TaxID=2058894 RepID=UPI000CE4352E|nr:hypothetical protein [Arthrobacter sp. GMC3]
MPDFGPFSVAPQQIATLGGARFGAFVTKLLSTEAAAYRMQGTVLEATYQENVGDGGVDAGLRNACETTWIPAGDSAWQFKAGDLNPAKCKKELGGATRALETLRGGGAYRLVLGASLPPVKIERRRDALITTATELGIANANQLIEVISADGLARWAEQYPAIAVSPILGGNDPMGQTFDEWADSHRHATEWVSSEERDANIETIRRFVLDESQLDIHIDGVSGLGKTRLALEALRGQPFESAVLYAPAADSFSVNVLSQLQSQGRTGIVVIDECERKRHESYASVLPGDSRLLLMTIGEPWGKQPRTAMVTLERFDDQAMTTLLRKSEPRLWPEAARVVVEVAAGNIDYALKAARAVVRGGPSSAGQLVTSDDVRAFVTGDLPEGTIFLACCVLALFSRFGYDGKVKDELTTISLGLGLESAELRAAAFELQRRGLMSKQGRFRSVAPYPIAVYLASQAWTEFGDRIVSDLIPHLDQDLTERLFRRAADLGASETTSSAVDALLSDAGPLASLAALAEHGNSRLLSHLAVIAPDAICDRLAQLIGEASDDELRASRGIRRDLMWTLEKLAWHSRTFEVAADTVLRLATVETETFSNNASGTWVELFGVLLPATAASPNQRISYLQKVVGSPEPTVRVLTATALGHALKQNGSIIVSGELQRGQVVERRGQPKTYADIWDYQNAVIDELVILATDEDLEVATAAAKQITDSIQGLIDFPAVRDHLGQALMILPQFVISRLRIEIDNLRSLHGRVDGDITFIEGLEIFETFLPPQPASDCLQVVVHRDFYDRPTNEVTDEILDAARALNSTDPGKMLLDVLQSARIPTAYFVGLSLADAGFDLQGLAGAIDALLDGPNSEAVFGYLNHLVEAGDESAYDSYIDEQITDPYQKLGLTVRGPRSGRAVERVEHLVHEVDVSKAAQVLIGWMQEEPERRMAEYLCRWLERISTQDDYNAVVRLVSLRVRATEEYLEQLEPLIVVLVGRRTMFPETGHESWAWTQLTKRQLKYDAAGVAHLLANLIESGAISAHRRSEERKLLEQAVHQSGEPAWLDLMGRLELKSWKLTVAAKEWLADAVELPIAARWVGSSAVRARILAQVSLVGDTELSPVARYLLTEFGTDDGVTSALEDQFTNISGSGKMSDRIRDQITQVSKWISDPSLPKPAGDWMRKLAQSLKHEQSQALEREAEEYW